MEQKGNNSNGKKVLVVEDEPGIALVCLRTLTAEGFDVDIAVNGQIGLNMLRQNGYDLCISDIKTPYMNGIDMYQKLVEEDSEVIDQFIFTTGDVLSGNIKGFLEATGIPNLPKPFTPEELRDIVRKVMVKV